MRSILFVCTANICRSPTAEGVLQTLLGAAKALERFQVGSAGTHASRESLPPFPLAVAAARRRGYDLSGISSRAVVAGDFDRYDLILAMDRSHLAHLNAIAPTRSKQRIELFLEYGDVFQGEEVPDPYGGTQAGYETTLDRIEDGCRGLVALLLR